LVGHLSDVLIGGNRGPRERQSVKRYTWVKVSAWDHEEKGDQKRRSSNLNQTKNSAEKGEHFSLRRSSTEWRRKEGRGPDSGLARKKGPKVGFRTNLGGWGDE